MKKLDLPNGWHRVPGDGRAPNPACQGYLFKTHTVDRYYTWAFIRDGTILALAGNLQENWAPNDGHISSYYLSDCVAQVGLDFIYAQFPSSPHVWEDLLELV